MKKLTLILLFLGFILLFFPDVCLTKGEGYTPPPDPDMPTTCTPSMIGVYWYVGILFLALAWLSHKFIEKEAT